MLNSRCNFPWLLSNVTKVSGDRLVNTKEYEILEVDGWRIGVMGLAEYGWLCHLNCVDLEEIIYEDYVDCGNKIAKIMRK